MNNVPDELLSLIGEFLPDPDHFRYQRTSKGIIVANRDETIARMELPSVTPLPTWARMLVVMEKGLLYYVPSFMDIFMEHSTTIEEEAALVSALCSIIENETDSAELRVDVSALRDAYFERNVAKQITHAHRIIARVTIILNVGGSRFRTSRHVMKRVPETFFSTYFNGSHVDRDESIFVDRDGSIFVDRDGTYFGYILEYMHDGVMSVEANKVLVQALRRELHFYKMDVDLAISENLLLVGSDAAGWAVDTFDHEKLRIPPPVRGLLRLPQVKETSAAILGEGHIYITGGSHDMNDNVLRYSIDDNEWEYFGRMPEGRWRHMSVVARGELYVLGGTTSYHDGSSVWKLSVQNRTWSNVAPMPCDNERLTPATCAVGDNIYVFGGTCGSQTLDTILRLDTITNTWTTLEQRMPEISRDIHAVSMNNGKIYLVGGIMRHTLCFDPSNGTFEKLQAVPSKDFLRSCFVYEGALCSTCDPPRRSGNRFYIHKYNRKLDTWTKIASDAAHRYFGRVVPVKRVVLIANSGGQPQVS